MARSVERAGRKRSHGLEELRKVPRCLSEQEPKGAIVPSRGAEAFPSVQSTALQVPKNFRARPEGVTSLG